MKRKIIGLFLIAILGLSLFSCKIKNKDDQPGTGNSQGGTDSQTERITIVKSAEIPDETIDYFVSEIMSKCNMGVAVKTYDANTSYGDSVIYIGDIPDGISSIANRQLSKLDAYEKEDMRYVAYTKGGSVAIVCDVDKHGVYGAVYTAIDEVVSSFIGDSGNIIAVDGAHTSGVVNVIEYQRAKDQVELDQKFEALYTQILGKLGGDKELTDEIYKSIKNIYGLYSDDMISWLANLYDPDTGGFYYSNSARNTIGYLPDIESTSQMLDIITSSGLASVSELPDWLKEGMVRFVKGLQDENGYFYHPQWGKELTDSNTGRRSRDLGKAVSLLQRLGAKPTYDTPSGVKGDGILSDGTVISKVGLTSKLSRSTVSAVSKVIATASFDYKNSYIESVASFESWLKTVDINSSSYQSYYVGDKFATIIGEIIARDNELKKQGRGGLVDALANWLYAKQNKTTGLWTLGSVDIDGVNGLFKIVSVFNAMGAEIKYPIQALQSTMTILNTLKPEDVIRVCDVFNIWNNFVLIKQNINNYCADSGVKSEVARFCSEILKNSASGLQNTTECLAIFVKQDGSFSYAPNTSAPTSHGMPVAVYGTNEGDVNGTALGSVGTICDLMSILGLTYIPIFTKGDGIEFISILEDMGTIIKHEAQAGVPYGFEDEEAEDAENAKELSNSCDIVSSSSITSSGGFCVVKREDGAGNALLLKSDNNGGDYIYIPESTGALNAASFIIESDIRIVTSDIGAVAQLQFSSEVYMLNFAATDTDGNGRIDENDHISIYEQSHSDKSKWYMNSFGNIAKVGEWFNIRIEYYSGTAETVRIKIFVNDDLIAVTDTYYGKVTTEETSPKQNYTHARFIIPSAKACELYIDNILVTKSDEAYTPENIPEGDPMFGGVVINVDSPSTQQKVHNFETTDDLDEIITSGNVEIKDGSLSISGTNSKVTVPVNLRHPLANCGVIEADVTVPQSTSVGATYEILFRNPIGNPIVRLYLKVVNKDGEIRLGLADGSGGKVGDLMNDFDAPIGEAFKLGIHYYKGEAVILVYVNGKLVLSTDSVCSEANTYRYTDLEITNIASGEILIDNLVAERRVESFELATSPEGTEKVYTFDGTSNDLILSEGAEIKSGNLVLSGTNASVTVPTNRRSTTGNSVIFVSDVDFASVKSSGGITVKLQNENGDTILAYELSISSGVISLCEITENKKYAPLATFDKVSVKLSIEYYPNKDVCEVFVDGVCVAKSSLTYKQAISGTETVCIVISDINNQSVRLDNIKAEIYEKLYMPSKLSVTNSENAAEKYTFDSSTTENIPSRIYTEFRSSKAALRIKEGIIHGKASKVLEYVTSSGSNDSLYIPVLRKVSGANAVAFEADIKLDMLTSNDGMELYLQVGSNHATKITLKYSSGKIAIYDNAGTINFNFTVENATWFNLRLEYSVTANDYTGDGNADALVKIYINDEHRGTGYNSYDMSYTADRITRARLYTFGSSAFTTYLDNLTVEQFMMDTAPHVHEYEDAWSYDKDRHYHKASCNELPSCSTATTEKIYHEFGDGTVCICGYEKTVSHEHEYSEKYSYDNENHWHEATCRVEDDCNTAINEVAPHQFGDDNKCVCGYTKPIYSEGDSGIVQNPDGWTKPQE